jgi:hypothetical protein
MPARSPTTSTVPKGSFGAPGFVPWLIHELTRVWRYQHGAPARQRDRQRLPRQLRLRQRGRDKRRAWSDGDNFDDPGLEQQGDILQDYYRQLITRRDASAFDAFVAQVRSGWVHSRGPKVEPITQLPGRRVEVTAIDERCRVQIESLRGSTIGRIGTCCPAR